MERLIAKGVSFAVTMKLARIISPKDYGSVAIISMFLGIFTILIDGGFSAALIKKKDADMLDYSSVLVVSMGISTVLYVLSFVSSPFLAVFYKAEVLKPAMRVMGLIVFPLAIKSVETAYISKQLEFKKFFFATLGGTILSAFVGIYLAVKGYGAWALVFQCMTNEVVDTIILTIVVGWDMKLRFSASRVRPLFKYGSKLMLSSLITSVYSYIRGFIIGKVYTTEDLAYYEKGDQVPRLLADSIDTAMGTVLFPAFSKYQDSPELLKKGARRALRLSAFVLTPVIFGAMGIAKEGIIVLFSDVWVGAVPYLYIFAITYLVIPLRSTNLRIVLVKGESNLYLKLAVIRLVFSVLVVTLFLRQGVLIFALSSVIESVFATALDGSQAKKMTGYGLGEQLKDIFPYFYRSILMFICIKLYDLAGWNIYLTLVCKILTGVAVYVALSLIGREENFYYSLDMIKNRMKKKG